MQQRVHTLIGKAQARGALPSGGDGTMDGLQGIFAEDAVVAETLGLKEPAIGRKADRTQLRQVVQVPADAEGIGIVDCRLGA